MRRRAAVIVGSIEAGCDWNFNMDPTSRTEVQSVVMTEHSARDCKLCKSARERVKWETSNDDPRCAHRHPHHIVSRREW